MLRAKSRTYSSFPAGDRLRLGADVTVRIFHPPKRGVLGSDNANSITMAVEHDGHRVLLPGDLETPGIEDVMAELPYDCDVLLAPRHGSRHSDPPGFVAWTTPNWVVISGGGGDDRMPVVETYSRAGANVLETSKLGLIHFSLGYGPLKMTSWRHGRTIEVLYSGFNEVFANPHRGALG